MNKKIIIFILLLLSQVAFADDYLDALEAEAEGLSVDKRTNANKVKPAKEDNKPSEWSVSEQSLGSDIPPGLTQKQFATVLKKRFFGSYLFYKKLTTVQKESVYLAYKRNNDVEKIRNLIVDYYKNGL